MPLYLYQARFTREALATLIEKPQDRAKGAATAIEAVGGKLHHYFFSFGEYDIAIIAEVPDNVSMAGIAMAVATTGAVTDSRTTILMTAHDGVEAMRQGQKVMAAYRPPSR
jgi:uncharacterized protein with GYD domain